MSPTGTIETWYLPIYDLCSVCCGDVFQCYWLSLGGVFLKQVLMITLHACVPLASRTGCVHACKINTMPDFPTLSHANPHLAACEPVD